MANTQSGSTPGIVPTRAVGVFWCSGGGGVSPRPEPLVGAALRLDPTELRRGDQLEQPAGPTALELFPRHALEVQARIGDEHRLRPRLIQHDVMNAFPMCDGRERDVFKYVVAE